MRLLVASDIHLGRIPSLPGSGPGITGRSAWEAVVQCALDQGVDAVLLAGDVVENDSAWFEAYGPLKKQLARLEANGIQVVAVAGNHDALVFPQLAKDSSAVTILGLGGQWQAHDLGPVRVIGWSFPGPAHKGNPMDSFREAALAEGRPYLGLLHCDLDGPAGTSAYAPVPARTLEATGAAAWVLGHTHRSDPGARDRAFYCGSPYALDAGEEGDHGVWLLTLDDLGQLTRRERIPLSPWEFRTLTVDLEGVQDFAGARERIAGRLEQAALDVPGGSVRTLYCSLRLHGACALTGSLRPLFQEDLLSLELDRGGLTVRATGRIDDATLPPLDLAELARGKGIRASLARLLLQAEDPRSALDELPALLAQVQSLLPAGTKDPAAARATLAAAARRLLMTIEQQMREA